MAFLAPWSTGIVTGVQCAPLSVLSHTPAPRSVITVALPCETAKSMPDGVPVGSCNPSCAAVSRCQVTPSREVQVTAWLPVLVVS
jgi:hypothetical protein